MFTGIIEHVGRLAERTGSALRLDLGPLAEGLQPGASVAVNGVCLTLRERSAALGWFDVVAETLRRTALGELQVGDAVNLERSLRLGDRLDGHFVQGHVEDVGRVTRVERDAGEWLLWVTAPVELRPMIVPKGSIALEGVSLTIAAVRADEFCVALIPTTLARTTLGALRPGSRLNLETDLLARVLVSRCDALLRPLPSHSGGEPASGVQSAALHDREIAP
jgi:riboflavin synthase alpha subunit